jgi:hypothetical protein
VGLLGHRFIKAFRVYASADSSNGGNESDFLHLLTLSFVSLGFSPKYSRAATFSRPHFV